ncbi:MAG: hypothetical protein QGF57_02185, partial [Candidatus Marinimicrobia bacterium]|nr:hypothetical protein [Candidatus Neomarinimicrobiota bacterium]
SWLKRTDYFAIYNHRKPKEIQLWQLSEQTASPDAKWTPQVRKIELVDEYNRNNPKRSSNRKKQERPKRKL